jgi:hypothetical protein
MSAKDAPGEVKDKELFDSPNISASEEEEIIKPEVDKEAEEQKKRETVDIDGVPIDDKDIKYKASDIRKKGRMNYFVHVTDASKYEKLAEKRKAEAKRAAEHRAAEEKREAEHEEKVAAAAAVKKQAEEKKHIDEVNEYVKQKKREKAAADKKEDRKYSARRRTIIISAIAVVVVAVIGVAVALIVSNIQRIADEDAEKRRLDEEYLAEFMANPVNAMLEKINKDEQIIGYIENYQFEEVYRIYDEYLFEVTDNHVKAYVYMDLADKIRMNTTGEEKEVVKVMEKARIYEPEDRYLLSHLQSAYFEAGEKEKAKEVKAEIDRLAPLEVRIGDAEDDEEGEG